MNNVRKLTEGAILLTIYIVLLLITIYVPLLGMFLNFLLPLPFIIFAAKYDWKGILLFVVASLLLSFIAGTLSALTLTIPYGTTGAVMGFLIQKNKSRTAILVSGSIIFLLNLIIGYAVSVAFFHMNLIDDTIKMLRDAFSMSSNMLKGFGQQQNASVLEQFDQALSLMKILIPTAFVLCSFMVVFIIQLLSVPILKRFGMGISNWKPFREISLPKSLLWYYLGVMIAGLLFHPPTGSYWYAVLLNLTYLLQMLMFFQGITFIFYFANQKGISKSVPVILAIMSFVIPFMLYIIGILGIMDLGFGLRKRSGTKG